MPAARDLRVTRPQTERNHVHPTVDSGLARNGNATAIVRLWLPAEHLRFEFRQLRAAALLPDHLTGSELVAGPVPLRPEEADEPWTRGNRCEQHIPRDEPVPDSHSVLPAFANPAGLARRANSSHFR